MVDAQQANRQTGKLGKRRYLVLGMDPGIASCGFALLDLANHEILEMGSRLFDASQNPKTKMSRAAERRGYRSARRNLDRTQDRRKSCLALLQKEGVVPEGATKEWLHTIKGDKQPLALRVEGLDRLLSDREWARVLYSLCKRRGYIPHGEGRGGDGADAEGGKVLKALDANAKALEEGGFRTVGEWLWSLDRSRNRGGNYDKCVTHEQLVCEVRTLFECQRELGASRASEAFLDEYLEVTGWERDRADFDATSYEHVGRCVYFTDQKRAARCTLSSELVAAYGALGNLTIVMPDGTERCLTADQRDRYISTLFSPMPIKGNKACKVTYRTIRNDLDLPSRAVFKGVAYDDEKTREVFVPKGWRILRDTLASQDADELTLRLREDRDLADAVLEAVAYSSSQPVLCDKLAELPLSSDEVDALAHLPFSSRALNGYGSRSKLALDFLLDALVEPECLTLTQAERSSGLLELRLAGHSTTRADRLVPYQVWLEETGRTNNNPIVLHAMAQMRKVVNAICREWGVPDEIHVELDRELALPKGRRDSIAKAQNRNRKENERVTKVIAEYLGCDPDQVKGSLVAKYELWEEQGGLDIYTGHRIELERLITDDQYTQVDHVLPFSRSGENSRSNKVLVLSKSNQDKRDRTPYEWMSSGEPGAPGWDEYCARVQEMRKLGPRKRSYLLKAGFGSDDEAEFLQRSITDTAYMSREVCAYLADCLEFPDDGLKNHVVPTKGAATAWLRRAWGLNFGLTGVKDRSDDRHHATDACVIAACDRSLVIRTAKYSEQRHHISEGERTAALAEAQPWPSFADDVRAAREHVIPTRHVPRKGTGEAFEQTNYAYVGTRADSRDILRANGKEKVTGNARISADGKSARIVSEMVCVRLWHDPEARPKGKVRGQWYVDPIYVADLPAIRNGSYVPRIAKAHTGRKAWEPIPERVLEGKPVVLFLHDAVRVGDTVGRFDGFDIAGVRWKMIDLLTGEKLDFPTPGQLGNEPNQVLHVIREDVLGHCWRNLTVNTALS